MNPRPARLIVLVAVVVAAVAGVSIVRPVLRSAPLRDGGGDDNGYSSASGSTDVNEPLVFGLLYLTHRGDEIATIHRVHLLDATPGLRLLGVYVVDPRTGGIGLVSGDHLSPEESARPVPAGVAPAEPIEFLIEVSAPAPGRFGVRGFAVDYHDPHGIYRYETRSLLFQVCAPADVHCPEPTRTTAGGKTISFP